MNVVIYIRVSTTEQAELGYSLKAQEEACREYAKRNKYEVLRVFIERGESAKTTNRTELKNMLEFVHSKSKEIDFLIVFKIDRLTRNMLDYANLISLLSKYGIILKSATESISETPEGKLMQNIIASFAQYDNDQRSQRTRSGMIEAVKAGRWIWKAPIGYKFIIKEGKSYLIPSEEKQIIQKIFMDFANGKKQYEIIKELHLIGFHIAKQKINKILVSPVYIGKIKSSFFEEPITGLHEPIIDDFVFYKAQDILNRKTDSDKSYDSTKFKNDFPLRRFLKCPFCNKRLTGSWSKGRSKKYAYYHCTTTGCSFKPVKKERVESLFIEQLKSFEPPEGLINNFFDSINDFMKNRELENNKIFSNIQRQLTELENKKIRIEDLAIEGTFAKDRFIKKINEVEEEIIRKKAELSNIEIEKIDIASLLNYCKYFITNLSKLWINAETKQKIKIQDLVFPEGIFLGNEGLRTAKINPILNLIYRQKEAVINSLSTLVAHRGLEPLF